MSDGTLSFSGRIVDSNVLNSDLVNIEEVQGSDFPFRVITKAHGTYIASFATQKDAEAFLANANPGVLYR